MKPWQQAIIYILTGMAIAFGLMLFTRPARGLPIQLTPVSPVTYQVQVDGNVGQPGLFSVPVGTRLGDVIQLAGGVLPGSDESTLNLARPVKDGERIFIDLAGNTTKSVEISVGLLDINQATLKELDALPGIGEVKANAILTYRQQNGNFVSMEELLQVPGITADVYEKIKDLVKVQ